jgi:hypothetical protein
MFNSQQLKKKKEDAACCSCLSFLFKPKKTSAAVVRENQSKRVVDQVARHRMMLEETDRLPLADSVAYSRIPYHRF